MFWSTQASKQHDGVGVVCDGQARNDRGAHGKNSSPEAQRKEGLSGCFEVLRCRGKVRTRVWRQA